MQRQMTVAGLLTRAFAVLVLLILLSGSAGVVVSVLQHNSVQAVTEQVLPMRVANKHLRSVLSDAQRSVRGYSLTGDRLFLEAYDSASVAYAPALHRLLELAVTPQERAAIREQDARAQLWWAHANLQRYAPPRSDAAAAASERGRELFDPILETNDALDAALVSAGERLRERSQLLQTATLLSLVALTALALLVAGLTAVRTTGRITRPLDRLVAVLDRLREGRHEARAQTDVDLQEIGAVALAVNGMAEEADRVRMVEAEAARLGSAARDLGVRVRQHLSVEASLDVAASGLGELLAADHAVIRLTRRDGDRAQVARWRRDGAPGDTEMLAALGVGWLGTGAGCRWVTADAAAVAVGPSADANARPPDDTAARPPAAPPPAAEPPAEERRALGAAHAVGVVTVAYDTGSGSEGAVTLIRCRPGVLWTPLEVQATESVAADLARGLLQAELYEREQELVARLQDLDNAKTDFMSTVSHELRTPLTSIAGYLEMLRDGDAGNLSDSQQRMFDVIERNTSRLRVLIEDLLVLSKIEAGTFKTNRRETDFGWLVGSAVAAVTPTAAAAGVVVDTDLGPALGAWADPDQIDRVLMNLLSNAVKFTPDGGRVEVGVHRENGDIVLRVADTGMGIPEPDQRHLFNRFFRASNAMARAIPGTGLGLAIVGTIVANHGGRIAVSSREGGGTTVTVRLPS